MVARHSHSCSVVRNGDDVTVIVAGGYDKEGNLLSSVEILSFIGGSLSNFTCHFGPPLPWPIASAQMVTEEPDKSVVLVGGLSKFHGQEQALPDIYRLEWNTETPQGSGGPSRVKRQWEKVDLKLKFARSQHTAIAIPSYPFCGKGRCTFCNVPTDTMAYSSTHIYIVVHIILPPLANVPLNFRIL